MITKFKITRAPKRSIINILGAPYTLGQEYNITNQSSMNISTTERGVSVDDFGFKLGNEAGVWSPEYNCIFNAQVNTGEPQFSNLIIPITLNQQTDITSQFVFDDKTDRVLIIGLSPAKGFLTIDGSPIRTKPYHLYEFKNVIFNSVDNIESQNSTSTISLQVYNKDGYNPVIYTVDLIATSNLAAQVYGSAETSNT